MFPLGDKKIWNFLAYCLAGIFPGMPTFEITKVSPRKVGKWQNSE